ncbi:MAG: D-alanyl-D-alanine carboxypeptidase [Parvularculaceae bacterium]|nr:D-alanyl-D-alanine carboxypeptidase [Parvularculaceae bacterium]
MTVRASAFCCVLAFISLLAGAQAQQAAVRTSAKNAVIMDMATGKVLFGKRANVPVPPASMSKLMTVAVVLDLIKQGKISTETLFTVSEKAWRTGGSKMFVLVDTEIAVGDLLKGIVVQSGNDACIVVAENIAGSEAAFAELMNARARVWGLEESSFANPTGLPHPEQRMSMRDLATLTRIIWNEHPDFRYLFSIPEFTWSNITQANRNPLLGNMEGAMGMKTGHTDEAGFGVVGLAERDGLARVVVVSGLDSDKARRAAALDLMDTAFDSFEDRIFFNQDMVVGDALVFAGQQETVPLRIDQQVRFILHKSAIAGAKAELSYEGPLRAPIREGDRVGVLKLSIPGEGPREYPLYTAAEVEGLSFLQKVQLGMISLLTPPEADQ